MGRSTRAHRRYTVEESRAVDRARDYLQKDGALATFVRFVNHRGDWEPAWQTETITAEPFSPNLAEELQRLLRHELNQYHMGRVPFPGPCGIELTYVCQTRRGAVTVQAVPSGCDLDQYLHWVLLESIRTGTADRLRECPTCAKVFVAKRNTARTCSSKCQDARSHQRRRDRQRRYEQEHFGTRRTA